MPNEDDLEGIRRILGSRQPTTEWKQTVLKAFHDTTPELAKAGFDGFVDELADGHVILAVIAPSGARPCLLIGPSSDETTARFAYGTTIDLPDSEAGFELSGSTVQGSVRLNALTRHQVIQIIEHFLASAVPA